MLKLLANDQKLEVDVSMLYFNWIIIFLFLLFLLLVSVDDLVNDLLSHLVNALKVVHDQKLLVML